MKSKAFQKFDSRDGRNEELGDDLRLLLSLPSSQTDAFVALLLPSMAARSDIEGKAIKARMEEETGWPVTTISIADSLSRLFLSLLTDDDTRNENVELWMADLREMDIVTTDSEDSFLSFIASLKRHLVKGSEDLGRVRSAESGVLPSFKGIGTTVELRGIYKEDYRLGANIETFQPEVVGVVPVVSIAIKVDSGMPEIFAFQASAEKLEYLIASLKSAQKSAEALEQKLGPFPAASTVR